MNWILLSPPPLSADPDTPKIWNVHFYSAKVCNNDKNKTGGQFIFAFSMQY